MSATSQVPHRNGALRRSLPLPRRRALLLLPGLCVLALCAPATPAQAIYGPAAGGFGADLVSVDLAADEQANGISSDAAISGNGRYVVFQTTATNLFEEDGESEAEREAAEPPGTVREGGIFRYDRLTGQLQLVASGNLAVAEGAHAKTVLVRGAENPSVSANGRYVAFSSAETLLPHPTVRNGSGEIVHEEAVQVYEREMEVPTGAPGAYRRVSVPVGATEADQAATFAPPAVPSPRGNPGAEVWPNTSISADGRYVAFRSEAESNLDSAEGLTDTPPGQLFVRDLQEGTTTLVTRNSTTEEPVKSPADVAGPALGPTSISADGSTVAWVSSDAAQQTKFLLGESPTPSEPYYLWRRWQPQEKGAVTRRITGMADPEDPECTEGVVHQSEQTSTGPCYGPLTAQESTGTSISSATPGLSANGYTVAFLAAPGLRPDIAKPGHLDVFLTSMAPGVTRKAGTSELTLAANGSNGRSQASIQSLALSADGSTIAFTTTRDLFVLGEPAPIGTFSPVPLQSELYVIHLGAHTLERAVVSDEGTEPNGPVAAEPTLSADGSTIAFAAGASNLVYGDAHAPGELDVFAATYEAPTGTGTAAPGTNLSAGGFSLAGTVAPELGVRVRRGRTGEVILLVETPGPGRLEARAVGTIVTRVKSRRTAGSKRRAGGRVRRRHLELAHATATAPSEGTTTLVLHLPAKYASDLRRAGKLGVNVSIGFTPPSAGEALSAEAAATFYAGAGSGAKKSAGHARRAVGPHRASAGR